MQFINQFIRLICLAGIMIMPQAMATTPTTSTEQAVVVMNIDKVNINSATADQLQKVLIGIGSKKANAIVQYRDEFGPFVAVEQLLEVSGFGKATLEKNRDRIVLE